MIHFVWSMTSSDIFILSYVRVPSFIIMWSLRYQVYIIVGTSAPSTTESRKTSNLKLEVYRAIFVVSRDLQAIYPCRLLPETVKTDNRSSRPRDYKPLNVSAPLVWYDTWYRRAVKYRTHYAGRVAVNSVCYQPQSVWSHDELNTRKADDDFFKRFIS